MAQRSGDPVRSGHAGLPADRAPPPGCPPLGRAFPPPAVLRELVRRGHRVSSVVGSPPAGLVEVAADAVESYVD